MENVVIDWIECRDFCQAELLRPDPEALNQQPSGPSGDRWSNSISSQSSVTLMDTSNSPGLRSHLLASGVNLRL